MAKPGCGEQKYSADTGIQDHMEVREQVSGNTTEQYGGGTQRSPGSILYQEGGKTYASLPVEMLQSIKTSLLFDKLQKDCKAEGIEIPKNIMAKDPVTHILTPQEYLQKVEAGTMPPMDNHLMMKQMAESATLNNQTKFMMMEFRDIEHPALPKTPHPPKHK